MTEIFNRRGELELRRQLRNSAPTAEQLLWQCLRRKQVLGLKFRRQTSIGSFIVDFYCPELRLAVEVDGMTHAGERAQEYDALRQEEITQLGITFIRVTNNDVYENIEGVVFALRQVCLKLTGHSEESAIESCPGSAGEKGWARPSSQAESP